MLPMSLYASAQFGRSRRVWVLPPSLGVPPPPPLGAAARRRRNPLLNVDGLYSYAYICVLGCQY